MFIIAAIHLIGDGIRFVVCVTVDMLRQRIKASGGSGKCRVPESSRMICRSDATPSGAVVSLLCGLCFFVRVLFAGSFRFGQREVGDACCDETVVPVEYFADVVGIDSFLVKFRKYGLEIFAQVGI